MNILLIDDEPFALKLLERQLENLGFEGIIPCEHAHEALAALESGVKTIDLVFCDLQMPQMDGVEIVRHLARIGYAEGLVLVSGEDERILQAAEKLAKAHNLNVLGALHSRSRPNNCSISWTGSLVALQGHTALSARSMSPTNCGGPSRVGNWSITTSPR